MAGQMVYYSIDTNIRSKTYGTIMLIAVALQSLLNQFFSFMQSQWLLLDISSISAFAIFTVIFIAYDNFIWRWKIKKLRFSNVPDFSGEWVGYILERTEFTAKDGHYIQKLQELIAVNLYVRQTFRQMSVRLHSLPAHGTKARESECTTAGLFIQDFNRPKLTYTWIRSDLSGMGEFLLKHEDGRNILEGHYQSNYPRSGLIRLVRKEEGHSWYCGEVTEITNTLGRSYLGVHIPETFILPCLNAMKTFLSGEDFEAYRHNQNFRDDGGFHMTIIEPREYQNKRASLVDHIDETSVWLRLVGLGRQTRGSNTTFFCVLNCDGAEQLRNKVGLGNRDMHVTLGFRPDDLHDVPKGESTLLVKII